MRITNLLKSALDRERLAKRKKGAPPGTPIFTGQQSDAPITVHYIRFNEDFFEETDLTNALPEVTDDVEVMHWIDVRGLHGEEIIAELTERYDIHPLAQEDILDVFQRPKLEVFPASALALLKAFAFDDKTYELSIEQVSIYFQDNVVITFQEDEGDLFQDIRNRIARGGGRVRRRPADYLAYALVDNVVDGYFVVLDKIEARLDQIEDRIMKDPDFKTKSDLHDMRLDLLTLRKNGAPTRELASRFASEEDSIITEDTQRYAADLRDHVIQITDLIETYRDVTNGLYDLYVSEISLRMNRVMQTLTVVSTIFIPLSFLVGVYGMNFEYIPELHHRNGYFILWGVMIAITVGSLLWFRSRRWL